MSIDFEAAKQNLLQLKQEYQTRIADIEDHIQNPQDDLNEHWEDQAIAYRQNDMRKNLMVENVRYALSLSKHSACKHCLMQLYVCSTLNKFVLIF